MKSFLNRGRQYRSQYTIIFFSGDPYRGALLPETKKQCQWILLWPAYDAHIGMANACCRCLPILLLLGPDHPGIVPANFLHRKVCLFYPQPKRNPDPWVFALKVVRSMVRVRGFAAQVYDWHNYCSDHVV